MGHFGPKIIVRTQSSRYTLKIFKNFKILWTLVQEAHEIYISDFRKKDLVEGKWVVVNPKMLCPQNSGYAFKDFF